MNKEKQKSELKLCPFCGEEATLREREVVDSQISTKQEYEYIIECDSCPAEISSFDKEEAIKAWNTRK